MYKTVNAFFNFNERTELCNSYNRALNYVADIVFFTDKIPRLGLKLFVTERNLFLFGVDRKNFEFVLFVEFENFAAVFDVSPAEVGNMSEAVETAYVNECAELSKTNDSTFDDIANGNSGEERFFFSGFSSVSFSLFSLKNNSLRSNYLFSSFVLFDFFLFAS